MKGLMTEAKNIGWGTSSTTASTYSNVNLFQPATEPRVAGTSSYASPAFAQLGDTYQVTGSITCSTGAKTITEVGLFDTTTSSTSTTISNSLAVGTTVITFGVNPGPTVSNYYIQVLNETMLVSGANSTTLTVVRGQLGSAAGTQASGSPATIGGDGGAFANGGLGGQNATVGAAQGGDMFIHADFAGVALNVNDSISFTITDTLT
jgi:hypothetical protein